MDCNYQIPSLLPYLRGTGEIKLDFSSVISEDFPESLGCWSGVPISYSDSLALRYRSCLLSEAGSLIRNVTLLIQRDDYPAIQSQSGITNTTIEQCWQLAVQSKRPHDSFENPVLFKSQVDEKGKLSPYAPLFYCRTKAHYFHPPCSRCGNILHLCTDDNLLGEFGLPYYSKSFHRYLYCPTCTPLHGKPWYVKSLKGEDGAIVRDYTGLLQSFGEIKEVVDPQLCFPCGGCSLQDECFGLAGKAAEIMVVVSFYPFNMLVVSESDFDGADFLALVAGASPEDLRREKACRMVVADGGKGGGEKCIDTNGYFFHRSDTRHFLEILYLKLLFLRQADDILQQEQLCRHLSPRQIGVSVLAQSILPIFWSYSLSCHSVDRFMDEIVVSPSNMQGSRMSQFGLFWFAVLLTNRQIDESALFTTMNKLLTTSEDWNRMLEEAHDLFHSRNIYWNPVEKPDDMKWSSQWEKVLAIGRDLLVTGRRTGEIDDRQITASIASCLAEIKGLLFQSDLGGVEEHLPDYESAKIYEILQKIANAWEHSAAPNLQERASPGGYEKQVDPHATVIIPADTKSFNDLKDPEEIIKQASRKKLAQSFSNTPLSKDSEMKNGLSGHTEDIHPNLSNDLEETIRIGSKNHGAEKPDQKVRIASDPIGLLEETVVMKKSVHDNRIEKSVDRCVAGSFEEEPNESAGSQMAEEDDFLTETVVLKPMKKGG